jgi:hypothetical protein
MALGKKSGGRKKGTPNKTTAALKDAILTGAEEALPGGKVGYLKWLAKNNSANYGFPPTATSTVAIFNHRFTSIRDFALAQIAVIAKRGGEREVSTRCCPSRVVSGTEGMGT